MPAGNSDFPAFTLDATRNTLAKINETMLVQHDNAYGSGSITFTWT